MENSLKIKYPYLYDFVNDNIVPSELMNIEQVINIYIDRIITCLKEECDYGGLDCILYLISPYPSYLDFGISFIKNAMTSELNGSDIVKDFKNALKNDNIKFNNIDGSGF